ncbi:hypothetical protein Tco_0922978 [Tanacetum coccineum]|uniref:Zinc finger, CCHC-type n=1 Tax=Tanacetum coccineum TaxID=301880 RepID=A0ABQ5D6V0_9ASTR
MDVNEHPLSRGSTADSEAQVLRNGSSLMNGYVSYEERLGYVLPRDISVGLILNGLTSDFAGFVRNYNMHNMGKIVGELQALLIEYEKGLPKKAATPQVMVDQVEVGHWKRNCLVYMAELIMKKKQVGTTSSSGLGYEPLIKRDTPDKLQQRSVKCIFIEISGRAEELKEIQDEDTSPSKNASEIPMEVEGFKPPQEDVVPIRRSARTHRAPDSLCLNVVGLSMNAKMQSMKDNQSGATVRCTRPDVAFAQNITIYFQQNPGKPHLTAVKTILKYLRNTKDMFLVYGENPEAELRVIAIAMLDLKLIMELLKSQHNEEKCGEDDEEHGEGNYLTRMNGIKKKMPPRKAPRTRTTPATATATTTATTPMTDAAIKALIS